MKTLKAAVAKYNSVSLILRILVGLAVGVVLALVAPGAGWVAEFGSLFVGALKGIAPVLVFVIVASALAQGSSRLDRRFGTVIWLYMLTTFLAAAIAVMTSFLFPVTVVLADAAQSDVVPQGLGEVMGTLLTNFVANPVAAIMNGNYIGILFWACMFGIAMKGIGSESTKTFMANTADAVSQIVRWIINLAPFGIMGLVVCQQCHLGRHMGRHRTAHRLHRQRAPKVDMPPELAQRIARMRAEAEKIKEAE